nr:hypothetical protein Iba_chr06aCG15550 [Ipomoea batatas]GMD06234.1 hypothetical protein Iba_chr06bCG14060 [Ipomoea batatas]
MAQAEHMLWVMPKAAAQHLWGARLGAQLGCPRWSARRPGVLGQARSKFVTTNSPFLVRRLGD